MNKNYGLGRGLGALIGGNAKSSAVSDNIFPNEDQERRELNPSEIKENPRQPRKSFAEENLHELEESIRVHGIIQPLIVSKIEDGYELIAGERRLRAARALGLQTVPVVVRNVVEQEKLELALIENVQRKDLNPLEEALAYQELIDDFNLTQEEVGARVGKERSTVSNTLRLLRLPEEIQEAILEEKLSEGHARAIAALPTLEEQLILFRKILSQKISVRESEEYVQSYRRIKKGNGTNEHSAFSSYEKELQEKLATKVSITHHGSRGKIIIEFYGEEDLDTVMNHLRTIS